MASVDGYRSCDYEDHVSLPRGWPEILKEHHTMRDALLLMATKPMMKCELIGVAKETVAAVKELPR